MSAKFACIKPDIRMNISLGVVSKCSDAVCINISLAVVARFQLKIFNKKQLEKQFETKIIIDNLLKKTLDAFLLPFYPINFTNLNK